jgi:hypothetical protein
LIGDVAPDHHAVEQAAGGLDLRPQDLQDEGVDAVDEAAQLGPDTSPIHSMTFSGPMMRHSISWASHTLP